MPRIVVHGFGDSTDEMYFKNNRKMFDVIQDWIDRAGLTREAVLTISNNQTFGYANNPKGEIFRKFLPDRFFEIYVSGDDPVDGMVKMLRVWADVEVHPIVSFHERMK